MRLNRMTVVTALAMSALLTAGMAMAQSTTDPAPSPPPQICVNGQCASTVTASTGSTAPASGGAHVIKWNPGHYMDSESVIRPGSTVSNVIYELNDLNNQDAVLGYRVNVTWGALEPTEGNYDFSVLDAILAKLKTAYNKPKRLVIYMWLYNNGAMGKKNDGSTIPLYIQQNQIYGPSPVSGSYGWWGQNANNASTGMYAPAIYTQPVMDRLIALVQALGQHYDADPNVEAIDFQEDATIAQCASAYGVDPRYSDANWLAQLERLLPAATAAFPHTSVIMDNSWFDRPPPGVALQQWMAANRIAPGSADTLGQSMIDASGYAHLSIGMQTLMGQATQYGGTTDLRPVTRAMLAVEGPDIFGSYYTSKGGPFTPLDILNAVNKTYWASHVFWTHLVGTEFSRGLPVPAAAKWSNLVQTITANPLIHTDYPKNYP